ncbi:hypothetical protein HK097_003094, partial [Rhizophlyctis rosea]
MAKEYQRPQYHLRVRQNDFVESEAFMGVFPTNVAYEVIKYMDVRDFHKVALLCKRTYWATLGVWREAVKKVEGEKEPEEEDIANKIIPEVAPHNIAAPHPFHLLPVTHIPIGLPNPRAWLRKQILQYKRPIQFGNILPRPHLVNPDGSNCRRKIQRGADVEVLQGGGSGVAYLGEPHMNHYEKVPGADVTATEFRAAHIGFYRAPDHSITEMGLDNYTVLEQLALKMFGHSVDADYAAVVEEIKLACDTKVGTTFNLRHVKSHLDEDHTHVGNDLADILAKRAAMEDLTAQYDAKVAEGFRLYKPDSTAPKYPQPIHYHYSPLPVLEDLPQFQPSSLQPVPAPSALPILTRDRGTKRKRTSTTTPNNPPPIIQSQLNNHNPPNIHNPPQNQLPRKIQNPPKIRTAPNVQMPQTP